MVVLKRALPLLLLLAGAGGAGADSGAGLEYQVKAAFLLNFARFVEWPADAFQAPGGPLTICVVGKDPFGDSLDGVVRGETVNGRHLAVRRLRHFTEADGCQVLFVPRTERDRQAEITAVEGAGVLTVGEADGFLTAGGIIRFALEQNKVRFEINLAAAERNRLKLSSKLLRLARKVYVVQPGQEG